MRETTRPWGGTLPGTPPRGTVCGGYRTRDDEPNDRPADTRPPGHPKQPPPPPTPAPESTWPWPDPPPPPPPPTPAPQPAPRTLALTALLLAAGWWGGRLGNRHNLPGDYWPARDGDDADWPADQRGADSPTARRRGQPPRDNQGDKK